MNSILQLQKLSLAITNEEMGALFMSTASGICPTNAVSGENYRFEMQ